MNRENAIGLAIALAGSVLLLVVGLPLVFWLVMGGGMTPALASGASVGGMMAPMVFLAAPLVLAFCLIALLPAIVFGVVIYAIRRNHKPVAH